ncbi:Pyrimidine monooxygenase RutA [Aquimixticola soesokkakensis]|uniref:Pyrimidine monooxygenase RutA n=1 Tax=Aquimixticola soesokkakensis TaxID=1519096 RepID=A0A1Y5T6N6_9RHOB|nr:LLM class flavin-dependent oxidoreductase [Aquimixticola soesokkakensis]SLN57131.1 Pyrimidine monooxygenase RutA [Aquimixticola soesokkakensis]
MTQIGVFVPVGSRGWLISTTGPKTYPTFDFNKAIVQRAEHFGFDFALSMIKLRGYNGPSEYWVHNMESFTVISGLAAVTKKIKLFASCAMLTLNPAYTARMAATMDSIAPGRIGVNMVTGWQPKEYQQMGLELTPEHFARRYDYASEYVQIMQELWQDGVSNFKGDFFTMDDCKLSPRPAAGRIPIVGAGQSEKGMEFVAKYGDYNFVGAGGDMNETGQSKEMVAKVNAAAEKHGRDTGAFLLLMVIADRTEELAFQKWEHYKSGTDIEALEWQASQASADKVSKEGSTAANLVRGIQNPQPTGMLKLIGSYEQVAAMLDEIASTPGLKGIMLTFDDFIIGIEQFGQYIQPLMKTRNPDLAKTAFAAE